MPNYCSNKCCSPSRALSGPYGLLYPWDAVRTVCSRSQVTACGWWSLFVVFLQLRLGRRVGFLGWTERVWEVTGGPSCPGCLERARPSQGASWAVVPPSPIYLGLPNTSIAPGEENTAAIFSSLWVGAEAGVKALRLSRPSFILPPSRTPSMPRWHGTAAHPRGGEFFGGEDGLSTFLWNCVPGMETGI